MDIISELNEYIEELDNDQDKTDLRHLVGYLRREQYREAYMLYTHLDTYVRECLPEEIVQFITLNRCGINNYKTITITMKHDNNVLGKHTVQFPSDISDFELSRSCMHFEDVLVKKHIKFDYE